MADAPMLGRDAAGDARGAVVVIDVLRAFSTAAYAFGAGVTEIVLVESPDQAFAIKEGEPDRLLAGEHRGRRIDGFDFPNSPYEMATTHGLAGRRMVLRTSAGTRGAVGAVGAERLWCSGLATASATAAAVRGSGLGTPTYVITGQHADQPERGQDDRETATYIESVRSGGAFDPAAVGRSVASGDEAITTLRLGAGHVHPDDIVLATRVDAFDFAMEASRIDGRLVLTAARPNR